MKSKCDNQCETCPLQGQIYCILQFAKSINERLCKNEDKEDTIFINPITERETHNAEISEDNLNQVEV